MREYQRVRDLEGLPRVEIESAEEFFDAAMAEYPDAPRWVGELYFETHRGTFTSQARTKAGNRRCELLLREAELWCVAAYGTTEDSGYSMSELDRVWKTVLLHQFHDILPGSSIGWVHREAEATYAGLIEQLEAIYGFPNDASTVKVADRVTPAYRALMDKSPFAALATSGPEGLDCSPRGDAPGFVRIHDDRTLMMPDWRGNNRVDSLRNIVRDPRIALLFLLLGLWQLGAALGWPG